MTVRGLRCDGRERLQQRDLRIVALALHLLDRRLAERGCSLLDDALSAASSSSSTCGMIFQEAAMFLPNCAKNAASPSGPPPMWNELNGPLTAQRRPIELVTMSSSSSTRDHALLHQVAGTRGRSRAAAGWRRSPGSPCAAPAAPCRAPRRRPPPRRPPRVGALARHHLDQRNQVRRVERVADEQAARVLHSRACSVAGRAELDDSSSACAAPRARCAPTAAA